MTKLRERRRTIFKESESYLSIFFFYKTLYISFSTKLIILIKNADPYSAIPTSHHFSSWNTHVYIN